MQPAYIPATDADYSAWLANFSARLTATPVAFGLVAGDATAVAAANTAFQSALEAATNPATRTSPAIAAKDSARAIATRLVRPYATQISRNPAISNELKLEIGVNLPNAARTPIPAPATAPTLNHVSSSPLVANMGYADSTTPTTKAKPFGATGLELRRTIGTAPAVDPDAAAFVGLYTKSPLVDSFDASHVGKIATYFARWRTASGPGGLSQTGPWSVALSFGII